MNALLIEAVPAGAFGIFAVAIEKLLAIVADEIVFAGNIVNVLGDTGLENLIDSVELFRLGKMTDIAGVQKELRSHRQRIDFLDRRVECSHDIWIGGFVEAHVAVADLDKAEVTLGVTCREIAETAKAVGLQDSATQYAERAGASPGHTLEEAAAVNAILIVVVEKKIVVFRFHGYTSFRQKVSDWSRAALARERKTGAALKLLR